MDRKQLIRDLARTAGKLIKNSSPTQGIVEKSGRMNFATAADLASEKLIIATIKKHFPDDQILSEETHAQISDPENIGHLWVIDPIDGTNNFAAQRNYSAVSIGYVEKGVIKLGCAYNPFVEEFYLAEIGKGIYLNGKKMQVGEKSDLEKITLMIDNSYHPEDTKKLLQTLIKGLDQIPFLLIRGSAVLAMCDIACGRADIYFHTSLEPWDNTAAFLIIREAGGIVKDLENNDASFLSPIAIAGNKILVEKFLEKIKN